MKIFVNCFSYFPSGMKSKNLIIRKELGLFAFVQRCYSFPGVITRHKDVDIVVIRENTEGEYSQVGLIINYQYFYILTKGLFYTDYTFL